ncbi:MAG: two-component system response regulator (stage 0 sporulation protein F), partial [Thalassolituus oleivorans]
MKVLIVDDERDVEPLFNLRFRKEIRRGEIELVYAFSGEEALA